MLTSAVRKMVPRMSGRLMNAYQSFDNATFNLLSGAIGNANAQAAANNYVAANATLDAAALKLQAKLKSWVDTVNSMLANSTANSRRPGTTGK